MTVAGSEPRRRQAPVIAELRPAGPRERECRTCRRAAWHAGQKIRLSSV